MSVGKWFVILSDHGKIERVKISTKINRISVTRSGVFFCTGTVRVFERVLSFRYYSISFVWSGFTENITLLIRSMSWIPFIEKKNVTARSNFYSSRKIELNTITVSQFWMTACIYYTSCMDFFFLLTTVLNHARYFFALKNKWTNVNLTL